MKKILISAGLIVAITASLLVFISDRDRGMWLLNSSIKLLNPRDVLADIPFGDKPWQKLDVYPAQTNSASAPVVVFVHGGSWSHGRKDQYFFAADAFLRLGYTVVLPDYIKYPSPEARFPTHVVDGAKAIAWVKANIAKHKGDPRNIFIAGHSAGAHTVAMLATDGQYLNSVGLSEEDIRGMAGIAGPYSFVPAWKVTQQVFGPPERYPLMDTLNYVDGSEPSTLLLHTADDRQVGQYNQEKLAASLKNKGVDVETILYQGLSHIDTVTHLHPWFAGESTIAKDIDKFFKARLKSR